MSDLTYTVVNPDGTKSEVVIDAPTEPVYTFRLAVLAKPDESEDDVIRRATEAIVAGRLETFGIWSVKNGEYTRDELRDLAHKYVESQVGVVAELPMATLVGLAYVVENGKVTKQFGKAMDCTEDGLRRLAKGIVGRHDDGTPNMLLEEVLRIEAAEKAKVAPQ